MRKLYRGCFLLCCVITIASCSPQSRDRKAPESGKLQPESAHGAGEGTPGLEGGLKFTPPRDWIAEKPSSSNRHFQYRLPRVQGDPEDAELVVYYFAGGGGTPQANVDRWIGQFTGPDGKAVSDTAQIKHENVDGIHLTIVDVSGAYSSSMGPMQPGGRPKSGFRLLGAIAEAKNGPWFIKLTGPERTIAKWKPGFESFLNSIKQGE